ncbi:MAG: S24/S26 family peptidase [Bacteroidia bacterium]|nr:S24/S26 family peptidase [Bacteroidia bacterium]
MTTNKRTISNLLFIETMNDNERIKTTIKGNSMLPFIVGGRDVVTLVRATPESVQKGRVVVARINEKTAYLHRIERVEGNKVTLRGDGNPYSRETCPISAISAEAIELNRNGKLYTPNSLTWKAARYLWPSNGFLRRVLLAIYRKLSLS